MRTETLQLLVVPSAAANSSTVQFPIPSERSPLHLLLIEQQIERGRDGFRSPAQLLCKVALADDHISSWELLVDSPSVNRNSLGETPQFLLLLQFGAFSFRLVGLKCPDECGGDAHSRCDQAAPPFRGNGCQNTFEGLHGQKSSGSGVARTEYQQHRRTDRLRESCASRLGMYNKAYKIRIVFSVLMLVLIVLLVSWLAFRAIGAAGVHAVATWQDCARYALVVMFLFTATAHFNKMKHDLARMIPTSFPRPLMIVYITGVLELLGAAGLVLPQFRRFGGICLIALLVGMFIANVNAAQRGVTLRGKPPTPLWLRAPMQILFIALLWWSTRV